MKDLLTLFVLPAKDFSYDQVTFFTHWPRLRQMIYCQSNDRLEDFKVETPFFAYCYSNERPDEKLRQALNFHFKLLGWDFLVLYRKIWVDGQLKYFRAPRVFRSSVRLANLLPDENYKYSNLHVLEGFLV